MPIFNANNLAGTELSQSVSTSDTSISVVDASVFPATPFLATIDDNSNIEIVKVTSVSSNTLTVERGKEDTTAQSFDTGVQIEQRFTAGMYENLTNTEESQDAAWSIASGGSNISVGYDDTNDSVSIDFTGTLYSDEDAQDAVGGILNADFNYDDAGNSIALASNSFTVANTTISLGESGTPEADNLAGNNGTSGQVLQTDGSNLSFVDISSFSGDFNDLSNVPELPEGVSLNEYRTWQNQVVSAIAKNQFEVGLAELGYPDGFFDVFVDESKISFKDGASADTGTNGQIQIGLQGVFDVDFENLSFIQSFSLGFTPQGVEIADDGNKLFVCNNDNIYEYNLSTPYDVTTASQVTSIPSQDTTTSGIVIAKNGTRLYEAGNFDEKVYQYNLSTAYDLSTANLDTTITAQDKIKGIALSNDGTKLFEIGLGTKIYESELSTAYDLSTASFVQSISTEFEFSSGIEFSTDGSKMFETDEDTGDVAQYSLTTAYDVSTATVQKTGFLQDSNPQGIDWKADGTKLYEVGQIGSKVYEYNCGFLGTNGSFTSTVQNLGYSASRVTVTADYTLNGQSISAELRTGSGKKITDISESELGDTISISTTATDYNIKWNLDGDGNDTPVLNSYEVALDDGT